MDRAPRRDAVEVDTGNAAMTGIACLFALLPLSLPTAGARAEEREVTFAGHGGFELSGTLLLPPGAADRGREPPQRRPADGAPALVLLPGSGPTDRDGNQPPLLVTDLLEQVAAHLAQAGYATLRFDKRAAHVHMAALLALDAEELREFLGFEAFVGDARAALAFLRSADGVDGRRVGLFGHSEGGLIGLALARELGDGPDGLAALVLAGTAGTPLADVLRYQIGRSVRIFPESVRAKYLAELDRAMRAVVETGRAPSDLDPGIGALFPDNASKLLQIELALDPGELAAAYAGPVLVLQGERDVQIPADLHPRALEVAFAKRVGGRCEVVLVPDVSHNFKRVASEADPGFVGEVAPEALGALVEWLARILPLETGQAR